MKNCSIIPAPPKSCDSVGIDVSDNNGQVDWNVTLECKIYSIFAKATEGMNYEDKQFAYNAKVLNNNIGIIITGTYHYFRPIDDGKIQAEFYISTLKKYQITPDVILTALDVETLAGGTKTDLVINLCKFMNTASNNGFDLDYIYASPGFWNYNFDPYFCGVVRGMGLWQAEYTSELTPVNCFNANSDVIFWQYTNKGQMSGISGSVDLDCSPNIKKIQNNREVIHYPADSSKTIRPLSNSYVTLLTIDVSSTNGEINWYNVSNSVPEISTALIRASDGLTQDSMFVKNAEGSYVNLYLAPYCYHALNFNLNCTKQSLFFTTVIKNSYCVPGVMIESIPQGTSALDTLKCIRMFIKSSFTENYFIGTSETVWNNHFNSYFCKADNNETDYCYSYKLHQFTIGYTSLWLTEGDAIPNCWTNWTIKRYGQGEVKGINGLVNLNYLYIYNSNELALNKTESKGRRLLSLSEQAVEQNGKFKEIESTAILIDALKQGAFHGIVASLSEKINATLIHFGYSKQKSAYSQSIFYYSIMFAAKLYTNLDNAFFFEGNILSSISQVMVRTIVDMAVLIGINYTISQVKPCLNDLSESSEKKGWFSISQGLKILAKISDYIPYGFGFFSSGAVPTAVSMTAGSIAKKTTDVISNFLGRTLFAQQSNVPCTKENSPESKSNNCILM